MNPAERAQLVAVAAAITRQLPGASLGFRESDYGTDAGEVLVFRVGPARTIELLADSTGWFAAIGDGPQLTSIALADRRAEALGFGASASPDEVAAAFVGVVRRQVQADPGAADSGLVTALAMTPSFAPTQPTWPSPPRPRRSFVITLASVVAAVLLAAGLAGGFAWGAASHGSTSSAAGNSSGSSPGNGSDSSGDGFTGTTPVTSLKVGNCFDSADAIDSSDKIRPTACTQSHDSEVFAVVTVPNTTDGSGRLTYDQADELCFAQFAPYVGDSYNDSGVDFDVFTPSSTAFEAGDRSAYCYIELDDPLKKSVKGSGL
ncbi:hypothetical protein AX769_15635 [Frondihabitans sp. PAMC 28766]|uniref:septum formation family protein n=1 Tax=Frondihabitans sp. PAMC 28766 TaxID=1795630 RepID=UPI00078BBBA0|nr:septum formation family protein [Frondihabitans sp. PAMC 28766]AMM21298.1 hypothetical protein AX769_15635 [Frondihabitans sp. PAMC 28766]